MVFRSQRESTNLQEADLETLLLAQGSATKYAKLFANRPT